MSVKLTIVASVLGFPAGAVLGFGMYLAPRWAAATIWVLTEIGRGFPTLVIIYVVYFGLPKFHIVLAPFPAVVLALAVTTGSYTAEVFRSALASVPVGQLDAARAIGMGRWATLWYITGRQATRTVLPPLIGFLILVFQGTSLAYSVGVQELMSVAYTKGVVGFQVRKYVLVGAVLYLIVSLALESVIIRITRTKGTSKKDKVPDRRLTRLPVSPI
jgi:polar amino acid transport system permease protein